MSANAARNRAEHAAPEADRTAARHVGPQGAPEVADHPERPHQPDGRRSAATTQTCRPDTADSNSRVRALAMNGQNAATGLPTLTMPTIWSPLSDRPRRCVRGSRRPHTSPPMCGSLGSASVVRAPYSPSNVRRTSSHREILVADVAALPSRTARRRSRSVTYTCSTTAVFSMAKIRAFIGRLRHVLAACVPARRSGSRRCTPARSSSVASTLAVSTSDSSADSR